MAKRSEPRNFFVNEQHELSPEERRGGGGALKLAPVDWAAKGKRVSRSLEAVGEELRRSRDPAASRHYYVLTRPESAIRKVSERQGKTTEVAEPVSYGGLHSRTFHRLGIDLIDVAENGDAIVHINPETARRLINTANQLDTLGVREQARWVSISEFSRIPDSLRADAVWLERLPEGDATDVVVELQPLLSRLEGDEVMRAISGMLGATTAQESILASGRDFSGRLWFRSRLLRQTVTRIVREFFSVQSVHGRLTSAIAIASASENPGKSLVVPDAPGQGALPCVGIVDCGVPPTQPYLAPYRRGTIAHPDALPHAVGNHGSSVASRVVFGDLDLREGGPNSVPPGDCRFLDLLVAFERNETDDKFIVSTLETAVAAYPDVRVFNLSFSNRRALGSYEAVEQREKLRTIQDLDNFAFARDVAVIVAAGNSVQGQIPQPDYPANHEDQAWGLGHWASTFNTLVSGAFVRWPAPNGIVDVPFAPSPFCKVGPGIANSGIPQLASNGGDWAPGYRHANGLGVFCMNAEGLWEDRSGTSLSTPIVARQVAHALHYLERVCEPGTRPFASTAKAFLCLTATRPALPKTHETLASRTLGQGEPDARLLADPNDNSACFIWQGLLSNSKEQQHVQLPIPLEWLRAATEPYLEACVAWDTPVNAAAREVYGCRAVGFRLRPSPDHKAARARVVRPAPPKSFPLLFRRFDLKRNLENYEKNAAISGDVWLMELSYEQVADYPVGMAFAPVQKVSVAVRLVDVAANPVSPQRSVQAHPLARTMTRLSRIEVPLASPVRVRV